MGECADGVFFFDCRKFFGAKNAPPTRQTKLSFSTRTKKDEPKEGEVDGEGVSSKENSDLEKGMLDGDDCVATMS